MTKIKLATLLLCAISIVPSACQAQPGKLSMPKQRIEPEVFATIDVNAEGHSACTPAKPREAGWQGILINAPTSVAAPAGQQPLVPVCVLAVVPVIAPSPPETVIVAIDRSTGARYSGKAFNPPPPESPDDDAPNPNKRPPRTQDEVSGMTAQIAFTTEIVAALRLPKGDGAYDVHVERGAIRSNTVSIKIQTEN